MGKTSIEWTDASWNPIVGCTEISPGCANCYADMGDLFHETVDDDFIEEVFFTIAKCPQHTFQILTKRAARMHAWISKEFQGRRIGDQVYDAPLPNVWLGVSVENQHFADERIPLLLQTPAAVRWISAEPLLGLVDISLFPRGRLRQVAYADGNKPCAAIDWVVCGGEWGPNARPMHPEWARSLRDQCQAAGVPFFFKQWGEFIPEHQSHAPGAPYPRRAVQATTDCSGSVAQHFFKVGKHAAGRLLDWREWNEFPSPALAGAKENV